MSSDDVPTMNANDPRAVPGTMDRQVLKAALANRLFAEQANIQVGRFIIIERAGSGGMGVVYRAYDPELEREVAIKLLLDKPDDERQRLVREARAAAKVVHPNVVSVFEVGVDGDNLFVAMEYVAGSTLRGWGLGASPQDIVLMHIQAGRGLAAAHAAGVIHRDYKPDNVLIGPDGRPRVADFGLARAVSSERSIPLDEAASTLSDVPDPFAAAHATASKGVLGTPAYMAPEQFHGGRVDHAADQYSFCVALYEGLTGTRPFGSVASFARDPKEALATHANVERRVRRVLERGLSIFPEDRYPSMQALLTHLERASTKRTSLYIGGGVVAGAIVIAAVMASTRPDPTPDDPCANQLEVYDDRVDPGRTARLIETVEAWGLEPAHLVEDRLAVQRETWGEVAHSACREYRVDGATTQQVHDAKRTCLDTEAGRLSRLVEQALGAEEPLTLLSAVDSTISIIDCGNTDVVMGLEEGSTLPSDATEVLRERVRRLETQLELEPLAKLVPEFEALDREARLQPDLALQAEVAYALALQYTDVARFDDAEPQFKRSYRLARKANHISQAITTARYLGDFYTLYRDNTHTEAALWNEVAMAEIDDPRLTTKTVVATYLSGSYNDELNGRPNEALAARERALEILQERGVPIEDSLYLKVLGELAVSYEILGRYDHAEATYRTVIRKRMELFPNDTKNLSMLTHNFGSMFYHQGRHGEAIDMVRFSMALTPKEDSPADWIHSANNLSSFLADAGELDQAEELIDEVEEALETAEGSQRQRSYMLEARAAVAEHRKDFAGARDATLEAIEIHEEILPDDPLNGLMRQRLAYLLCRLGNYDEAMEQLDAGREQLLTAYPEEHSYLLSLELTRANVEWYAGDKDRAIEIARAIAETGVQPPAGLAQGNVDEWSQEL